jgi:hypothetical protein
MADDHRALAPRGGQCCVNARGDQRNLGLGTEIDITLSFPGWARAFSLRALKSLQNSSVGTVALASAPFQINFIDRPFTSSCSYRYSERRGV